MSHALLELCEGGDAKLLLDLRQLGFFLYQLIVQLNDLLLQLQPSKSCNQKGLYMVFKEPSIVTE